MKNLFVLLIPIGLLCSNVIAQTDTFAFAKKSEAMIPMRDGIKLFTVILTPFDAKSPMPVLLQRTPYGASQGRMVNDSAVSVNWFGNNNGMLLKAGYFLVIQDIRGKYKSEGEMQIHQPLIHAKNK